MALLATGRSEEGFGHLRAVVAKDPGDSRAQRTLREALFHLGRPDAWTVHVLRREAESLIKPDRPKPGPVP